MTPDHILFQDHTITLSWLDRVRVLFGRAIHLNVRTPTAQNVETLGRTTSTTWVEPVFGLSRKATIEAADDESISEEFACTCPRSQADTDAVNKHGASLSHGMQCPRYRDRGIFS